MKSTPVMFILVTMFVLAIGLFVSNPAQGQLRGPIRNLTVDSTPASGDMLLVDKASPLVSRKLTLGTFATYLAGAGTLAPTTRTITCTPPLLCAGGTSMDLSADRTLSLNGSAVGWKSVVDCGAKGDGTTNDATAINACLTALENAGGGVLYFPGAPVTRGRYIYNGAGIVDTAPTAVSFGTSAHWSGTHVTFRGDGILSTDINFTGCSNSYCIQMTNPNAIGSGYNNGGGIRGMRIIFPNITQNGIYISGLENFYIDDVETLNGGTAFTIGDSRGGTLSNSWISGWGVTGINITGENFAANSYAHLTLVSGASATGGGLVYHKTTSSTIDGIVMRAVAVNGTTALPAFDFTSVTPMNLYLFASDCVADGTFATAGVQIKNFWNVYLNDQWSVSHGTNAAGILLDATDKVTVNGGLFWAGSGASAADVSLKNTNAHTMFVAARLDGPTTGVLVDATTHDADLHFAQVLDATYTNDATKIVPTQSGTFREIIGGAPFRNSTLTGITTVQSVAPAGTNPRALIDAYAATPSQDFRRTDTSAGSPSAVQSSEPLGQITFSGYGSTAYSTARAAINGIAAQTWSDTVQGTDLRFDVTPAGGVTKTTSVYFDNSGHIRAAFPSPTAACTGTGTSPTAPSAAATDMGFIITVNTGTGSPGSTGTCTVTFNRAFPSTPSMVCMPVKGATAWGNGANIQLTTESVSAPVLTWTNLVGGVATALTTSTSYKFNCVLMGAP